MDKVLTISVAAYNVEKYLKNTLESLADDRYVDKLEVFVIDDGGQDQSLNIANSYEKKYPDTFHAVHKENGGYGSTVNYSIAHAHGKYFKLLDGDDWMDRDGLDYVLKKLEESEEDVIATDYYIGPSEDDLHIIALKEEDETVVDVHDYKTNYTFGMWAIIYKTEILRKSQVKLLEHTLYTDQIYSTIPFSVAKQIRFVRIPVYCYRFGRAEQSTSKPSRIKHAKEMFRVCDFLFDFFENSENQSGYLLSRISRYYIVALKTLMLFPVNKENKKKYVEYETKMKTDHPILYKSAVNNNRMGLFVSLLRKTGYRAYYLIKLIPESMLLN